MGTNFNRRIIFDALIFLSIFVAPWWVSFSFILLAFCFFDAFIEGTVFGLMIDLIYFSSHHFFDNFPVSFLFFLVVFLLADFLRRVLRAQNK